MKILIACEFSGTVRDAFSARGHEVWSCDLLPSERPGKHIEGDALDAMKRGWDMMIAFPPCTHLCVSGARWFKDKQKEQRVALWFVGALMAAHYIPKICIENPVGIISTQIRKPDQIIQPFQFGDPFRKTTCLWLKNLSKLIPTSNMKTGEQACWKMPPSPNRARERSRTYQGIAKAMAEQWG